MKIVEAIQAKLPRWLRKFHLSDIKLQEVRADEIALEREEKRLEDALDKAQTEVDAITKDAVNSGQKTKVRRAVRKIMQIKDRVRMHEAELAQVSRYLLSLGRLRRLVEGREELAGSGVLAKLERLPTGTLERVLSGAVARAELANEGLEKVAEIIDLPTEQQAEEPDDARQLRQALEAAIDAKDPALAASAIEAVGPASAERDVL